MHVTKLFIHARLAQVDPVVKKFEEEIVQANSELTALNVKYTENHSNVKSAKSRVETLKNEYAKLIQLPSGFSSYTNNFAQLVTDGIPINNAFMGQNNVYSSDTSNNSMVKSSNSMRVQIVESPTVSKAPKTKRFFMLLASGILTGLAICFNIILMRKILSDSIKYKNQIERLCKIPLLGRIC